MSNEIQLGKGRRNIGTINTENLKGGIKREQLTNDAQKAIFDLVDKDKNGVLDDAEMKEFTNQLTQTAGNDKLSKREAGKLLKQYQNGNNTQNSNLKNIDKKEVLNFIKQLSQSSENIQSTQIAENNGEKTIIITYKDGSVETINPDKTSQIATTDENNAVTTKFYDENKKLNKESIVQENGNSEVTEYSEEQPQKKTITLADGTRTTVINYKDGKEASSTVTEGATTSSFEYINGQPRLTKKIVDKGNGGKAESTYTYNENGSITETTEEANKKTVTVLIDNKPQEITITEGNKSTHQVYTEDGMLETIQDPDNKTETLTKYNLEGKRLSQGKAVDGKQYEVTYDGLGNTTGVVVQNGESIDSLAQKFGCKKEDIINANKDILNGKKTFNAGDTIKIPREIDADHKALQGRKSSEEAKAEYAKEAQKRVALTAKRNAENAQLKALGLQNRKNAGKPYKAKDGKTYTIVGNAAFERTIVKDNKGKLHVFAKQGAELKLDYVGSDIANVRAGKKRIVVKGSAYYVEGQRKGDKHGRYVVSDWHGNQSVLSGGKKAGEFSDRTILRSNYVTASDANDARKGRKTYLKDGSTSVTVNGSTYYFDAKGNSVDGNKKSTEIANAIKKDLDKAANDKTLGFIPDTDETLMAQANAGITDKVILAKINARYAAEGYKPNEKYKTAYEAFQGTELQRNEVYVNNAALVKNGAIQDQNRRNEILYTNVILYGNKSENLHAGLDAVSTREDYNQLNIYAGRANSKRGYQSQFKNQSALNTFIYGQTDGDAKKIKAANDALIDPNENFLTQEEITQTRAEQGVYFLQEANEHTIMKGLQARDLENALESNDGDIYRKMDELLAERKQKPLSQQEIIDYDQKTSLVSAGYHNFSSNELADLAFENLKWEKRANRVANSTAKEINSSATGNGGMTQAGRIEDASASAAQANVNIYALLNTKEAYNEFMKKVADSNDEELQKLASSIDKTKLRFISQTSNLTQEQISTNKNKLQQLKAQMADAERNKNNTFATEGVKKDSINAAREAMGLGVTRAQLNKILRNLGYDMNALELAAEGKLTDGNGKAISYDDLEKRIKQKIENTNEATQIYQQHQAYGEVVTDLTGAIITMPIAGAGIAKVVPVIVNGVKQFRVIQTIGNTVKELGIVKNIAQAKALINETKFGSQAYKLGAEALNAEKALTAGSTGIVMGAETYGMDRLDQMTSVSGDTMQARQATRDKAVMASVTTASGMRVGMSTSALDKNILQRVLGAGIDVTTDVAVASGVEYSQTGTVSEENFVTNFAFSAIANGVGHSMHSKAPSPSTEAKPKTVLDTATTNGTKMSGGKLGNAKFEQAKGQVREEIPTATPQRAAQIHKEAHQLQGQSRPQGREIKHIVEDGVGYLEIGKQRIPLDTATPEQLQAARKAVSKWSTATREKQTILNEIDHQLALRQKTKAPTSTRSSQTVDNINQQMNNNAAGILNGKKGAIGSHDAATLSDHITNNLNTVEELESFIGSLKNRVGVDSNGNMHVYQVEGKDHAAALIKQAQTKINNIKAHTAELNTVTGELDSAISAQKGLSEQQLATTRAFMNKSNSIEELEDLISRMNSSKPIRKSNAARKLISDMQAKVDILKAKQATSSPAPKSMTPEATSKKSTPATTSSANPMAKPQSPKPVTSESVSQVRPTPSTNKGALGTNPRLDKYLIDHNKPKMKISQEAIELANDVSATPEHIQFYKDNYQKLFKGNRGFNIWSGFTPQNQRHGAWKMHLYSVNEKDWQQMSEAIIPYLREYDIEWKTLNMHNGTERLNGGIQEGKAFTIYPRDNEHMAQVAKDLDYIIRNNNLNMSNSNIVGDRAMGDTGRLFYRYEYKSGAYKDKILDLSDQNQVDQYLSYYDSNSGRVNRHGEGRYLADDMTSADDPWLNFNPAK